MTLIGIKIRKTILTKQVNTQENRLAELERNEWEQDSKIIQQERTLTYLETKMASYILCFQNTEEEWEENLRAIITQLFIPIVGLVSQEIEQNLDNTWRSSIVYTRNNHIPREIHVKF